MADQYQKPYLDSSAFISWIKGEVVDVKETVRRVSTEAGRVVTRNEQVVRAVERGRIVQHILTLAEQDEFPIYTSAFTLAEVHKKRHGTALSSPEDVDILAYFEHDHIKIIDVDRRVGEEANRLCRSMRLMPADAVHLACALRAGCDTLLSWDPHLTEIEHPEIRLEEPRVLGQLQLLPADTPVPAAEGSVVEVGNPRDAALDDGAGTEPAPSTAKPRDGA